MNKKEQLQKCRDIFINQRAGRLLSPNDFLTVNLCQCEFPECIKKLIDRIGKWNRAKADAYLLVKWHAWFKRDFIERFGLASWEKQHKNK